MKSVVILSAALLNLNFAFAASNITPVKGAEIAGQMDELFKQCEGSHVGLHDFYDEVNSMAYNMRPAARKAHYRYGRDLIKETLKQMSCEELTGLIKQNSEKMGKWK